MYCTGEGDGVAVPRHNAIRHGVKYTRGVGGDTKKPSTPYIFHDNNNNRNNNRNNKCAGPANS